MTGSYTLSEVQQHNTESDCRTIINDKVYDITSYIPRHPGGVQKIIKICGQDGSQLFTRKHDGNSKAQDMLARLQIGTIQQ